MKQKPLASWYTQGLSDGLGDRLLMFDNSDAPSLELLRFRADLADIPGFEDALREQVQRLSRFLHPGFARVRSVQRLEPDDDLALVSNCPPGKRLSEVLHRARGPAFATALIKQVGPALAALQHATGSSHGLVNADRIVVTPEGRLTVVEHAVGPAIDTLGLGADPLASLGILVPPPADGTAPRLDVGTDWYQLGLVAVSVLIGRPVTDSDLPQLQKLLDTVAYSARVDGAGLSPFMRQWLDRALRISGPRIESGAEARATLEELFQNESHGDSRQAVRPLPETTPTPRPALVPRPEPSVRAAETVEAAAPVLTEPEPPAASGPAPESGEFFPLQQPSARRNDETESILEVRSPQEAPPPQRPPNVQLEQEALAGKRLLEFRAGPAVHAAPAPTAPHRATQRRIPMALVAGLALVATVEAGVIAWMARAEWRDRSEPIIADAAPSGDHWLISSRSAEGAPIRLAVAPDLRWVRVMPPASDRVLGGKVTDPGPGTLQISSPVPLKVMNGSRFLGSVPGADLKMAVGRHEIELVNEELGVELKQTVQIEAGETVSLHVAPPHGWVTIDAAPWAEVSIDGQPVGRTPLGPLPLSLGDHQIAFRHPAGSKDQQRVVVKSEVTTRVTGNLRFNP